MSMGMLHQYSTYHLMNFIEYEANFLKLSDVLTDGSRIELNESGMCSLNLPPHAFDSIVCIAEIYCEFCKFCNPKCTSKN